MVSNQWAYPAEKFGTARRTLMVPHPGGEAKSLVAAFHECEHGLRNVSLEALDDDARRWVAIILDTHDTTGIEDPTGDGTWLIKAEGLSVDQVMRFSSAVDGLATWFHDHFYGVE